MRALCWHGKGDVRVDTVPDPTIKHPRDAIIKITACAICGSDLHLLDGYQPTMKSGDILGHENMGEVTSSVRKSKISRRATASSCRSRSVAANAGFARRGCSPAAIEPIRMLRLRERRWGIRRRRRTLLRALSFLKSEEPERHPGLFCISLPAFSNRRGLPLCR